MAVTDWYRNEDWNEEIENHFNLKLGRTRTQHDQYLVIQALTLSRKKPLVALELVNRYFETRSSDFENIRALLAKSYAYKTMGDIQATLDVMKEIIETERRIPKHRTTTYVDFPYLVATSKLHNEYHTVLNVLEERKSELMFPIDKFKWQASKSMINFELGNKDIAKVFASLALATAKVEKSGFRFHQNLGLVGEEHKETIERLSAI